MNVDAELVPDVFLSTLGTARSPHNHRKAVLLGYFTDPAARHTG